MPTTVLSDDCDEKLKRLARPFETREALIERLADEALTRGGTPPNQNGHAQPVVNHLRQLNPDTPDNLTHTRVLAAIVDGQVLNKPKWNSIMDRLHVIGHQRLGTFDALKQASGAHLRKGRFQQHGYDYLPEADLSIQGVPAKVAWTHSLRLARTINVPVRLEIEWHDKPEAAHPGEKAILEWTPTT